VVVDELVLCTGQLEQLRKDSVNDHVLRLVLNLVANQLTELVKGRATLRENVHKELCDHFTVKVKLVDGVNDGISNER
jgi:hypothetical protein